MVVSRNLSRLYTLSALLSTHHHHHQFPHFKKVSLAVTSQTHSPSNPHQVTPPFTMPTCEACKVDLYDSNGPGCTQSYSAGSIPNAEFCCFCIGASGHCKRCIGIFERNGLKNYRENFWCVLIANRLLFTGFSSNPFLTIPHSRDWVSTESS